MGSAAALDLAHFTRSAATAASTEAHPGFFRFKGSETIQRIFGNKFTKRRRRTSMGFKRREE